VAGQPEGIIDQQDEADGPLVAGAVTGDAEAFRTLVERHQRRILALLQRLCGCPEQALDLAQETFLAAHRHLASFRQESRFSTWLHAIAVNQARAAGGRAGGRWAGRFGRSGAGGTRRADQPRARPAR
jgi:RNA polymerase sigma factor (sigma-70 family)